MILSCAIIDDEPLAAELLASYVSKTPGLRLAGVYESAVTAMRELRERPVDLLFLDIQMPELSGLEFATLLPKDTRIIFTTAFDRYAIADYLLKPVSYDRFAASVNKVIEWFETNERRKTAARDRFVYVKSEYKLIRLDFDDILYIEGLKDYVKIYFEAPRKPVLSLVNMKRVEDCLPSPQFMRVHRSFIVNMAKVSMVDRGRIVVGDVFIPVSESYKGQVQEYLDSHSL